MKRNSGVPLGLLPLATAALFMAAFLLLVVFGARTYYQVAAAQAENNEERALLSYLASCAKGGDSAGSITWYEGDEGPVLVLGEGSAYVLHIYHHEGNLLEQYSASGAPLDPQNADVLGATETFTIEEIAPGTLRVTTDAGWILFHLRSAEAAA